MLGKKRKANDGAAAAAAAVAGEPYDDDQRPPCPRIGRQSLDRSVHKAIAALLAIENAARTARQQLQSKAHSIKEIIESTGARVELTGGIDGEVELNVGGRVLGVSRKGLLLEQMRHTYLAHLLLYCVDALPRDEEGRPFLDADPLYIDWLSDEISIAEGKEAQGQEKTIQLDDTQARDPSFAAWHELFMKTTSLDIDVPSEDAEMDEGEGDKDGGKEGEGSVMDKIRRYIEGYDAAMKELDGAAGQLKDFGKTVRPFICAEDGSKHQVKTVTILRKKVSTTEATLSQLGPGNPLYKRFSGEVVQGDEPIRQTSCEHFMRVVDFARRLRFENRPGSVVRHPTARDMDQLKVDVEMFGLKMEDVQRPLSPILNTDETREVVAMTDVPNPTPKLLYSGDFGTMVDKVGDASGLLFLVNHDDTHRFGAFLQGQLKPPDPTQTNEYKLPLCLISISGAYSRPTKVPIPEARQWVSVAGRDGWMRASITAGNVDSRGKLHLGRGYLWLAFARPGPADDLRSMHHWVKKVDLPQGYLGTINSSSDGTLAASNTFTAKEIEIWHVTGGAATTA